MRSRARSFLICAIRLFFSCINTGEDSYTLINGFYRVYVEPPRLDGLNYFILQYQILNIARGDENTLMTIQAICLTYLIKAFDLSIYSTDSLNLSPLHVGEYKGT